MVPGERTGAELRKIVGTLVIVVILVVGGLVADHVAVQWTESQVASRIEHRFPGSHATVTISSSPYLPRLALFGTVQEVQAHVTDITDGQLHFDTVDVTAHRLQINRGDLLHGEARVTSLASATIRATISVAEALQASGYGAAAGLGGLANGVKVNVQAEAGEVRIGVGVLTFTVPYNSLVPCVGSGEVNGGEIILTCTTDTVPPALQAAVARPVSGSSE
jgi:LmeA-like phospholipid-binding